jgi:hypothetical protein
MLIQARMRLPLCLCLVFLSCAKPTAPRNVPYDMGHGISIQDAREQSARDLADALGLRLWKFEISPPRIDKNVTAALEIWESPVKGGEYDEAIFKEELLRVGGYKEPQELGDSRYILLGLTSLPPPTDKVRVFLRFASYASSLEIDNPFKGMSINSISWSGPSPLADPQDRTWKDDKNRVILGRCISPTAMRELVLRLKKEEGK